MKEGLENGKKVKKYTYSYEEYEEQGKGPDSRVEDILADPDLPGLTGIIIGDWGDAWEDGCQTMLDNIVENKERFSHIEDFLSAIWTMRNVKYHGLYKGITAGCGQLCRSLRN